MNVFLRGIMDDDSKGFFVGCVLLCVCGMMWIQFMSRQLSKLTK